MSDWFFAFLEWGDSGWWQHLVVWLAFVWTAYGAYLLLKKLAGNDGESAPDN